MQKLDVHYTHGINMFYAYIEYINSDNETSKKEVGTITDNIDLAKRIFEDEYVLEYMYMPQALLIVKNKKRIIARYSIIKIDNKLALIST